MMTPICRVYKSGRNILVRVVIEKCRQTNTSKCVAYGEDEVLVDLDTLDETQYTIPLVCIDGIKFSSRSFEVSIILRQMMFLHKENLVEQNQRCLIKHANVESLDNSANLCIEPPAAQPVAQHVGEREGEHAGEHVAEQEGEHAVEQVAEHGGEPNGGRRHMAEHVAEQGAEQPESAAGSGRSAAEGAVAGAGDGGGDVAPEAASNAQPAESDHNSAGVGGSVPEKSIEEVELEITDPKDTINLKRPDEVYYEIYRVARKKAKHMRQVALDAYLEAQQIKVKFSLDDLDETDDSDGSDSDSDNSEYNPDTSHLDLA